MRRLLTPTLLALSAISAAAMQPALPRHPAPSPDGRALAFSWQGDVWLAPIEGGPAGRLTANPGYDHHPVWFPDGARLAFASAREGGDDVYVMDIAGAEPRRLTFHESADLPAGLIGEEVIFTSRRHEAWDRMPAIYRIGAAGGTERLAARVLALEAVPSPDGRRLALVRGGTPAERRHYRGSANRDLWLLELATGALTRLTRTDWDEDGVSWAGNGALVFRSDGGGDDRNLYRLDLDSRAISQITHHAGSDVRSPRTSEDGRVVAYELWDAIYTVPPDGSAPPRLVELDVPADAAESPVAREVVRADADEVVVSPDESQVALVVRGDVFVVQRRAKDLASVAEAPTMRVTTTTARERDVRFSTDGKRLLYASDCSGQLDVLTARPADRDDGKLYRAGAFVETRLASTATDERSPRPSPDGTKLAYLRGKGDLMVADADGSHPAVIFEHWGPVTFAWSPDSAYLAFAREDQWHNTEVWIVSAAGGTAVNVSQHPGDDTDPVWSPDGRRLYWLSKRHAGGVDVWCVYLTRADHERTPEDWLTVFEDEKAKKEAARPEEKSGGKTSGKQDVEAKGPAKDKPKEARPPRPVAIDFPGIHERARALTRLSGDEGELAVSPDSQTVAFVGAPEGEKDLYKIRWDGKELARLTTGGSDPSQLAFAKDGKSVFYRTGKGTFGCTTLEGKAGDPTPFAARVETDRAAMRGQVFDEAWRELDRHFYDPRFHGVSWSALHDRYRPLALAASSRRDYDDVVNWMLGGLNASHMAFRPPAAKVRPATGDLGIEVQPARDGPGVEVVEVLPDTPAARTDVGLEAGERILAVDQRPLGALDNFFDTLAETVGRPVRLRVLGAHGEREVTVTPISLANAREARYREWVRQRRALADRLSAGKLGYIHIQGMDIESLEDFERDLFAAANGRQGLLIDVRNNGGGWTTDYLMAILNVRRHAWTVPRDGDPAIRAYPQDRLPLPAWTRPAAVLCDEASYSNAEIFSWAFKTTKRGPVIGTRTFGAVISTGGAGLADGSFVRLPERGWYVAESGLNMENHGCPPDHEVEQPPEQDLDAAHDTQLEKAVAVLLAELPTDPSRLPW